ncbi:MAG TPA: glycosyltransferase, partial [Arcobacter sp.]|nr:glycosyltransferase [Arcobacter sp.]
MSGIMSKRLLIIGSNSIHTYNFIQLIEDYFEDILLITNTKNEKYHIKSTEVNFKLGFNVLSSARKINSIVKAYNPSIIHILQANTYAFIPLLATWKLNIPKVITALGSDILINPKKNIILKKMLEFSLNNIDVATSDSLYMANEMKMYSSDLDIRIANFGISHKDYIEKKENIIYSNRLHTGLYNIEKCIYAFNRFTNRYTNWKLIIGGAGDNTDRLKQLVRHLNLVDKVEFIGWVNTDINLKM